MYKPKDSIWDVESGNDFSEVTEFIKKRQINQKKLE